jgi:hypothetical protein
MRVFLVPHSRIMSLDMPRDMECGFIVKTMYCTLRERQRGPIHMCLARTASNISSFGTLHLPWPACAGGMKASFLTDCSALQQTHLIGCL